MKRYFCGILWMCFCLMVSVGSAAFAQQPPHQQPPALVAGNWILYCQDPNGSTSTKYLDLRQNGSQITGHFKGPNQSVGVEGTIDEQHLVVRTKTRDALTFRGRVDGPRVQGVVQAPLTMATFTIAVRRDRSRAGGRIEVAACLFQITQSVDARCFKPSSRRWEWQRARLQSKKPRQNAKRRLSPLSYWLSLYSSSQAI